MWRGSLQYKYFLDKKKKRLHIYYPGLGLFVLETYFNISG